ncbi:phospholipid-transporting ATPase ABCA3-like [Antechinus flavipes]|uniref:phospholipid-transporting ATPase ABCA3-like n=1 Tax=Antechinus flavipes TaxID=38775 RepID=UPI0022364BC5|nr:phospholipid-transporting ATPase ABCA3-like [Antechinus flavipes]
MRVYRLFKLLLWKNYILKKRMFISTFLEIFLPLLSAGILIALRLKSKPEARNSIRYPSLPIDDLPNDFVKIFPPDFLELYYAPSESHLVKMLATKVEKSFDLDVLVKPFIEPIEEDTKNGLTFATIIFNDIIGNRTERLPLNVDYRLRFPVYQKFFIPSTKGDWGELLNGWNTHLLFPVYSGAGPREVIHVDGGLPGYYREGFLSLQHAVNREIMQYHMNDTVIQQHKKIQIVMKRFPFPSYMKDPFISILEEHFSILLMLSFLCTSIFIIRVIVQEKEKKLKEYMLIMGLRNWFHWCSWFFMYIVFFIMIISVMTILFSLKMNYDVSVLTNSDPALVFFFLFCFAISTISFSFMITVFFTRANLAVATGSIIYFFSYLPFFYINKNIYSMTHYMKTISCLSSNVAMALGVMFMIQLEGKGSGVQWKHVSKVSMFKKFGFGEVLIMLLIDSILYGLVTWYVEAVFPGQYGIPQPWYFFIKPSYWSGKPSKTKKEEEIKNDFGTSQKNHYIQDEPTDLVAGIRIHNLCKEFKSKNIMKMGVKNLTLNIFEGQITVLLGHNGAGKTTTLSILTGLFPATSGEVYLSGYEISKDTDQIRKSLGFCPQYDILFDLMTVAEHLYFYVQLKELGDKNCSEEINSTLNILKLEKKRNVISKNLSGGMKRKLSIGIALIGGSKVVMLDEPTSGMDPVSRRDIWDLLQNQKSNRTILLTTHFMDEADLLGDRIAILAKGELQCCGSSLFLKQKFGAGYHIIMVKESHCNISNIENLIYTHIPNAFMESNMAAELSFILPKENVNRFQALFEELEERQAELGISSFGASVTTMEEVFLRVSKEVDSSIDLQTIHFPSKPDLPTLKSKKQTDLPASFKKHNFKKSDSFEYRISQLKLHCQKFYAMFIKKVLFSWRNKKMMLAQAMVPLICVILTIQLLKMGSWESTRPMLRLTLNQYGHTIVPFFIPATSRLHPKLSDHIANVIQAEGHMPMESVDPIEDFLILMATEESDTFDENYLVAMSFHDEGERTVITALFNNQAYHSAPMALSVADNIVYKLFFGSRASITVTNDPEPLHTSDSAFDKLYQGPKGHFLSIALIFGESFIISSFAILAISERTIRSKHIQFISGISIVHYWLSFLLWDLITIFFNALLLLAILKIMDEKAYIDSGQTEATLLILMLHGWCAIPSMYLMSFLFSGPTSGCAKLILLNIVSGVIPFIVISITEAKELGLLNLNKKMDIIFQILPNYNLAKSFSNLYYNYQIKMLCKFLETAGRKCRKLNTAPENIYSWKQFGIGKYLTSMVISGFIFFLLLFFIETNFFWKLKIFLYKIFERKKLSQVQTDSPLLYEDPDVENEREQILNSLQQLLMATPLISKELTKVYSHRLKPVIAVNKVSFTVQRGECFGLLGFNGAGKTSIFKMLTGEIVITDGEAFINGKSIHSNLNVLQGEVSYCPQSDALLQHMTGRETLTMFARIWGTPVSQIKWHVESVMHNLLLMAQADKLVKNYSGGNKRKLSTGIALLGDPLIVFLDEPSTGMDPVARRMLWNSVTEMCQRGKAIVITSHSMEECEALCTKLSIMVNGEFRCLGSPQHLKSKYGSGYTLLAKIKDFTPEEEKIAIETFKTFVKDTFPGSILKDEHQGMVNYHLPKENLKWSKVFGILEEVKTQYKLDDYSISQVSLEQIFLSFAHLQNAGKKV